MAVHFFPQTLDKPSVEDLEKLVETSGPLNRGTAFAVTQDKFVTCYHVIQNLDPKRIKLSGAPDYTAGLPVNIQNVAEVESDPELDIALLKTERVQGDIVPIGIELGAPQVGLDILAVGFPMPEQSTPEVMENEKQIKVSLSLTFRALRGIIASRIDNGVRFEIDKLANPGQSGGPIVSIENGKLVGMCQAFRWYSLKQGAIPADLSVCLSAEAIGRKLNDWGVSMI